MSVDALRDHLAAFGLSEKEIEAYLAVLKAGTATAGEVSRAADVSQGYVYDIAAALADRGLVTVDETQSPTVLRARRPEDAIGTLSTRVEELRETIDDLYEQPDDEGVPVEVVHSRATVRKRARRALSAARHEALLVVPAPEIDHLQEALMGAQDRGVFVYLLAVSPLSADAPDVEWGRVADVVRTWETTAPVYVLVDETRGLMGSHGVLSGRHGEEYALAFSQREVGSGFFGNVVANFWPMGEDRYVTDPDPLPATYDHLRTAATNAALHLAAGRDLLADVRLSGLDGSERRYERVPVVEVRQGLVGDPTNDFPMENSLVFETPDGRVSAGNTQGGIRPFYEGYGATAVTLYSG